MTRMESRLSNNDRQGYWHASVKRAREELKIHYKELKENRPELLDKGTSCAVGTYLDGYLKRFDFCYKMSI